jgi:hypothetical protein
MSRTYIPSALRHFVYNRAQGCCEYYLIPEVASFATHEFKAIFANFDCIIVGILY